MAPSTARRGPAVLLSRSASSPRAAGGALLAGASEIDVTPHLDLPMAGYSAEAKTSAGVSGRLFARALVLEGADGRRVAIVVADLMSGTRYLHLQTAVHTAASCGIGADALVLVGTHTHTAPAWIYGNSLYDTFASHRPGFDRGLADWLAERMAAAVAEAADDLVTARIGTAERPVWGVSRNRSIGPFRADPASAVWNEDGEPGADPHARQPKIHSVSNVLSPAICGLRFRWRSEMARGCLLRVAMSS